MQTVHKRRTARKCGAKEAHGGEPSGRQGVAFEQHNLHVGSPTFVEDGHQFAQGRGAGGEKHHVFEAALRRRRVDIGPESLGGHGDVALKDFPLAESETEGLRISPPAAAVVPLGGEQDRREAVFSAERVFQR